MPSTIVLLAQGAAKVEGMRTPEDRRTPMHSNTMRFITKGIMN